MAKRLHEEQSAENAVDSSAHQVKKQKLVRPNSNGSNDTGTNGHSASWLRGGAETTTGVKESKELAKEHRKSLKRAQKNASQTSHDTSRNGHSTPADSNDHSDINEPATLAKPNGTTDISQALKVESNPSKRLRNELPIVENPASYKPDSNGLSKAERKALRRAKKAARAAEKAAQPNGTMDNSSGATTATASTPEVADIAYQEHEKLAALPQSEIDAFVSKNLLTVEDPLNQSYKPIVSFDYIHLMDEALRAPFANFSTPTPIQAACWPYLLAGRDVVGVAETGSGKTLAFALPCVKHIARLSKKERKGIKACVVSPTRELAMQIHEQMLKLTTPAGLKASLVYGGMSKDLQREALKGTHILVATPGRLNDFIQEGAIDLSRVEYLVLDEADRMLDKGFEQEVRKIISTTPSVGRQTLMFTATWPASVRELANTFMQRPVKITIGDNASGELRANANITQEVLVISPEEKQAHLLRLLQKHHHNRSSAAQNGRQDQDRILIFCLYKKEATRIEIFLRRKGYPVAGIHGDLSQRERSESLEAFRRGDVPLLVATDVAARGLDIPGVKVVVNFTFPLTVGDYVHRIGRTGRAGSSGKAVTLFTSNEKALAGGLMNVLKAANQPVPEELWNFGSTVKRKGHEVYGAFYRDTGDMKKATKITFD